MKCFAFSTTSQKRHHGKEKENSNGSMQHFSSVWKPLASRKIKSNNQPVAMAAF